MVLCKLEGTVKKKKMTRVESLRYVFSILITLISREQQAHINANRKENAPHRYMQAAEFKSI